MLRQRVLSLQTVFCEVAIERVSYVIPIIVIFTIILAEMIDLESLQS